MSTERISIMGMFETETQTAAAIRALGDTPFGVEKVYSPIPSHAIAEALNRPKSKVGWFTLAGGIAGFLTGFLFAAFTATRWSLIVGGKPVVALVPFFIVGFEFTILFAVFGNVLGLISQARLPSFSMASDYNPRFSGDRFGVRVGCDPKERDAVRQLFEVNGGEVSAGESM
jgi:hypothetical protein